MQGDGKGETKTKPPLPPPGRSRPPLGFVRPESEGRVFTFIRGGKKIK